MKFLPIENPQRDQYGMYQHPQRPNWDGYTTNEEMMQWLSDNNFTMHYDYFESTASEELQDKWFEEGINDCSEWIPKCDQEGAILLTIFDTDGGPVAWFLAPIPCKGHNCSAINNGGHSRECVNEHAALIDSYGMSTAGNRNPEFRHAGYSGEPIQAGANEDQKAAYKQGVAASLRR